MREVDLAMEEVGGGREGFGDVGEHVSHLFVDASPVGAAVNPLAILGKGGEVDGVGCAVPAEVGKFCMVTEPVIEWYILGRASVPDVPGLRRISDVDVAMTSRSSPSKLRGSVATDVSATTLRAEILVISRRREARVSMAALALSSSLSPTAETLHVKRYPQD